MLLTRLALLVGLLPLGSLAFTTSTCRSSLVSRVLPNQRLVVSSQHPPPLSRGARFTKPLYETSEAVIDGGDGDSSEDSGTSTMTASIFNLVKGIVGAGVLSLPAGIAAFGNAPSAVIPAIALIAVIGGLSGYCFSLIGRVCSLTGATSYREGWEKSVNTEWSWVPAVSVLMKTVCAVLAYSMILADTSTALLETAGVAGATRTKSLLGVTSLILLPLCWLKNLSSLAPFSLLGTLGMLYTAIAMVTRYVQKAYHPTLGRFTVAPHLMPSFGAVGATGVFNAQSFILICMLSTAYMAHFNAPKFYIELKEKKKFNSMVGLSFAISILLFGLIASVGYLTFGAHTSGLILNNYATNDGLMSFSRIAVLVSLIFSYPLAFVGVREGVLDVLKIKDRSNGVLNKVTVACLSIVTAMAYKLQDVSFVLAFAGATLGNALIYVFPSIMFRGTVKNMGDDASKGLKREAKAGLVTVLLGAGMGIIGAGMAVKNILS